MYLVCYLSSLLNPVFIVAFHLVDINNRCNKNVYNYIVGPIALYSLRVILDMLGRAYYAS